MRNPNASDRLRKVLMAWGLYRAPADRRRRDIRDFGRLAAPCAGRTVRYISLIALFVIAFPLTASASTAPVLVLNGPTRGDALVGHLETAVDPDWSRTPKEMFISDAFKLADSDAPHFGYTKSRIWMRLSVRNGTESVRDWRMILDENFVQDMTVFIRGNAKLRDGPTGRPSFETVLSLDLMTPFSERPVPYSKMVAPFELAPGEEATLLVGYWSGGISQLAVRIETASSFAAFAPAMMTKNMLFYGVTLALVAIALIAFAIARSSVFLAYACYVTGALFYLVDADGLGHQYLWPNATWFNDYGSIVGGTSMFFFGCMFARTFLRTPQLHPALDKFLLAMMTVTALSLLASPFMDRQLLKQSLFQLANVFGLLMLLSGIIAARTRFREVRFYLLGWLIFAVMSGVSAARHVLGIEMSREFQYDFSRFWLVVDALMMGLAIADRLNQQRMAAQRAVADNLATVRRNFVLSERLSELERDHGRAMDAARRVGQHVQDTAHDLRQPLAALRLQLTAIALGDVSREELTSIEKSAAYMEGLVAQQLRGSFDAGAVPATPEHGSTSEGICEPQRTALTIALDDIITAVADMFELDATAKHIELRTVATGACVDVPALVVMRCLSNLVSNAVNYTSSGRILVGVRHAGEYVRLEVHDTGPGMSAVEFSAALARAQRLPAGREAAEGHGLGLAIVADHARQHGFTIERLSTRVTGTGIAMVMARSTSPDDMR